MVSLRVALKEVRVSTLDYVVYCLVGRLTSAGAQSRQHVLWVGRQQLGGLLFEQTQSVLVDRSIQNAAFELS